jgi:hypothetical protein
MKILKLKNLFLLMLTIIISLTAMTAFATSEAECKKRIITSMENAKALGQNENQWGQIAANDCLKGVSSQSSSSNSSNSSNSSIGELFGAIILGGFLGLATAFGVFWIAGSITDSDNTAYNIVKWLSGTFLALAIFFTVKLLTDAPDTAMIVFTLLAFVSFTLPHGLLIRWLRKAVINYNLKNDASKSPVVEDKISKNLEGTTDFLENNTEKRKKEVREKLLQNKEDINNSPAMESFGAKMEIKNIAEMMSKQLPQSVDENTNAIKIEYLQNDNLLVFYYEVKNVTKEDIETNISSLKNDQIKFIKTNPDNGVYLKAEVAFKYIYSNSNGEELGSYTILPSEYM